LTLQNFTLTDSQVQILKNSKISFLIPCYGGAVFENFFVSFMRNVINLCGNKLQFTVETMANESLVTRARNNLIAKGMATDSTHLMFVDADIGFDFTDVVKMLIADKDVIGGLYPKKTYPIKYVVNCLEGQEQQQSGVQEVENIGTGFLMMKRSVIQTMFNAHPELKYKNQLNLEPQYEPFMYTLFDTSLTEDGQYLSEDWTFCRRWRKLGGKIHAHNDVKLAHAGYHQFS